jgi:16S rRNA (guanine527-N7)-methyltransferase
VSVEELKLGLEAGLAELGLDRSDALVDQLLAYQDQIARWNKVYNLTAVRDPQQMLTHHLLDSLAAIPPLLQQTGERSVKLLDVGSGGGLPGVVMAITCPQMEVHCVDTVLKKATFIQQVAASLKLPNLRGIHARVESLKAQEGSGYDVICSRAFASLADFTAWSRAALNPGGVWMAMKGKHPAEEIAALPPDVAVFHVEPLVVPGLDADRCIVWMKPVTG